MKFIKSFASAVLSVMMLLSFAACDAKLEEGALQDTPASTAEMQNPENGENTQNIEDGENASDAKVTESPLESNAEVFIPEEDDLEIMTVPKNNSGDSETEETPSQGANGEVEGAESTEPTINIEDIIEDNTGSIELPFVPAP